MIGEVKGSEVMLPAYRYVIQTPPTPLDQAYAEAVQCFELAASHSAWMASANAVINIE